MTGSDRGLQRWRLVLGDPAHDLGELSPDMAACDAALDWLYGRDEKAARRGIRSDEPAGAGGRRGGREPSKLTTFEWLGEIHRLFPTETIERLERDAVETFEITDLVTDPAVLARIEPNPAMLRAVLQTKHLMNPDVLEMARTLVARVVADLIERLATDVRRAFTGSRSRRPALIGSSRTFDIARTVRANLGNYQPDSARIIIERPMFFSRNQRQMPPWQVILVVDQSGSMVDSVIHSAVTASCLWGLPGVRAHLIAFDSTVVDLTSDVDDPVELLMKVNLGGGTDIARAMRYAAQLIDAPRRSIVVLISDLYEGGDHYSLVRTVGGLVEQGTHVLALAALDDAATAVFDRSMGQRLAEVGAHVGAMTPGHLAEFVAEKIGR